MPTEQRTPLSLRLVGEQVLVRPPRPNDLPELRALMRANQEHLRPFSPAKPVGSSGMSLVELSRSIAHERRQWRRDRAYVLLIAALEPDEPLVGRVALTEVARGPFQNALLGYWVTEQRQARGIATEAVRLAVELAFARLGLHRLQAAVMPKNLASRRVLEKLGFREEGVGRRYLQIAGRWEDHVLYALTREEWKP